MSKKDKKKGKKKNKPMKDIVMMPTSSGVAVPKDIGRGLKVTFSEMSGMGSLMNERLRDCAGSGAIHKCKKENPDEFKVVVKSGGWGSDSEIGDMTLVSIGTAADALQKEMFSMVGFENIPKLRGAIRYCVESLISPEQIFNSLYSRPYRQRLMNNIIEQARGMIHD